MWLKVIMAEMALITPDDFLDLSGDVTEGEKVVGQMTEDQIRLLTISTRLQKTIAEIAIKARFEVNTDEQREEAVKKIEELRKREEILREIMWVCIRDEFSLWSQPSIGIRKGFKVTTNPITLGDMLNGLSGR